jgi:hypothetical protein
MIGLALEFSALQSITQRRCLDVECFSVWGLRLTIGGATVMIGSAIGLALYSRIFQRDEWRQQRQQTRALMPKSYWHVYWGCGGCGFPLAYF